MNLVQKYFANFIAFGKFYLTTGDWKTKLYVFRTNISLLKLILINEIMFVYDVWLIIYEF